MNYLIDQSILLLYCLCSLFFIPVRAEIVIAFFLAANVCAILYCAPNRWFAAAAAGVYCLLHLPFPELLLFFPAPFYALLLSAGEDRRKKPLLLAEGAFVLCACLPQLSRNWGETVYILGGSALAVLLYRKTDMYEKLLIKCRKVHDADTERALQLKEKNRFLSDRQNFEIYDATLKERSRIAREIHDNVGHMLTRSILMVGALKTAHPGDSLTQPLNQLDAALNEAMDDIRVSVHDLHDHSIDLEQNLRALVQDFCFCPVSLQYDVSSGAPAAVKYCMTAVTREALVNISRHSNASRASVSAQEHPAFYQLSIRDNGTAPAQKTYGSGIGLTNMQTRVAALGGTLQIFTENGFCIYITIPKYPGKEAAYEHSVSG